MSSEITIDQTIALAASIGACLSAIAAFLAVRQVSKQRESSYRPDLVITRTKFKCQSNPIHGENIPNTWINETDDGEGIDLVRSFSVPLRNVGLGAAKGVNVKWSFAIEDLVSKANDLAQKSLTPAYFEYKNEILSFNSDSLGKSVSMWRNQQSANIDFVLPAPVDQAPAALVIPHAYIQLVSALVNFATKSAFAAEEKMIKEFPEIPALRVVIEYNDIGGSKHNSNFYIDTNIVAILNNGESFEGYVESSSHA